MLHYSCQRQGVARSKRIGWGQLETSGTCMLCAVCAVPTRLLGRVQTHGKFSNKGLVERNDRVSLATYVGVAPAMCDVV